MIRRCTGRCRVGRRSNREHTRKFRLPTPIWETRSMGQLSPGGSTRPGPQRFLMMRSMGSQQSAKNAVVSKASLFFFSHCLTHGMCHVSCSNGDCPQAGDGCDQCESNSLNDDLRPMSHSLRCIVLTVNGDTKFMFQPFSMLRNHYPSCWR